MATLMIMADHLHTHTPTSIIFYIIIIVTMSSVYTPTNPVLQRSPALPHLQACIDNVLQDILLDGVSSGADGGFLSNYQTHFDKILEVLHLAYISPHLPARNIIPRGTSGWGVDGINDLDGTGELLTWAELLEYQKTLGRSAVYLTWNNGQFTLVDSTRAPTFSLAFVRRHPYEGFFAADTQGFVRATYQPSRAQTAPRPSLLPAAQSVDRRATGGVAHANSDPEDGMLSKQEMEAFMKNVDPTDPAVVFFKMQNDRYLFYDLFSRPHHTFSQAYTAQHPEYNLCPMGTGRYGLDDARPQEAANWLQDTVAVANLTGSGTVYPREHPFGSNLDPRPGRVGAAIPASGSAGLGNTPNPFLPVPGGMQAPVDQATHAEAHGLPELRTRAQNAYSSGGGLGTASEQATQTGVHGEAQFRDLVEGGVPSQSGPSEELPLWNALMNDEGGEEFEQQ